MARPRLALTERNWRTARELPMRQIIVLQEWIARSPLRGGGAGTASGLLPPLAYKQETDDAEESQNPSRAES
jgi:hypothetical protein